VAGLAAGPHALLGYAGTGVSVRAGRAVGPSRRKEGKRPDRRFCFLFQKGE
jgi:hypothetical protein